MNSTRSLLLTGANGFIGPATAVALEGDGRKMNKSIRQASTALNDGSIYFYLSDSTALFSLSKTHRFDAIVHIGAQVDWSGAAEAEMFVPNVLSTG